MLAEDLRKFCGEGCSMVDLCNTESEKRCVECGTLNSIRTRKSHTKKKGAPLYDVNAKTVGVMIHFGLSVAGMQEYMASLEVLTVSAGTLKKRKRSCLV